jgi:hypothetical protein
VKDEGSVSGSMWIMREERVSARACNERLVVAESNISL